MRVRFAPPGESPKIPARGPGSPADPTTMVLVLSGRMERTDIPRLCQRVRVLLEASNTDPVVCDVGALDDPDAVVVDALARLQLTARRLGRRIRLQHVCSELEELIALMGLSDVVPPDTALPFQPKGQAEEREEACCVEEETDADDPTV